MLNAQTLIVGQSITGTIAAGETQNYVFAHSGKIELLTGGPIRCGIYGPQPDPNNLVADGALGKLRVEPSQHGERTLTPGVYLLQITGLLAGSYGITLREPTLPDVASGLWGWLVKRLAEILHTGA